MGAGKILPAAFRRVLRRVCVVEGNLGFPSERDEGAFFIFGNNNNRNLRRNRYVKE